jgi:hypothetical protein
MREKSIHGEMSTNYALNGEWRIENGERRMASAELRMARAEWLVASSHGQPSPFRKLRRSDISIARRRSSAKEPQRGGTLGE